MPKGIPMRLTDYLELLDWTGRQVREDKRGHIDHEYPPILERLDIGADDWLHITQHFEDEFSNYVGMAETLRSKVSRFWQDKRNRRRIRGLRACTERLS